MPGVALVAEDLPEKFGGGGFFTPTPEACETECFVRKDFCAAWTFILNSKSNFKF